MSGMWNIKRRLLIGGPILIVIGLAIYAIKSITTVLVLPVVGLIVLIIGVLYKPQQKKKEIITEESADEKSD